jgi:hypothetical protein
MWPVTPYGTYNQPFLTEGKSGEYQRRLKDRWRIRMYAFGDHGRFFDTVLFTFRSIYVSFFAEIDCRREFLLVLPSQSQSSTVLWRYSRYVFCAFSQTLRRFPLIVFWYLCHCYQSSMGHIFFFHALFSWYSWFELTPFWYFPLFTMESTTSCSLSSPFPPTRVQDLPSSYIYVIGILGFRLHYGAEILIA